MQFGKNLNYSRAQSDNIDDYIVRINLASAL